VLIRRVLPESVVGIRVGLRAAAEVDSEAAALV
jgi:hypothetical protein